MGTPEYMSPEQGRGEKLDFRSDVYSLGIVIFEIFTGRVPFRGDTRHGHDAQAPAGAAALDGPPAARLPRPLVPVLAQALSKAPDERHQSAAELALALIEARDAAGIAPIASGPVTPRPIQPPGEMDMALMEAPTVAAGTAPSGAPVRALVTPRPGVGRATPGAPRGTRPSWLVVVVALCLAVAAAWLGLARRTRPKAAPAVAEQPPAPATVAAPPVAAATATLVVDALPWGEITEVVDGDGRQHPLGKSRCTPLALVLPAGRYTVSVRNPGFPRPLSLVVTLDASEVETSVVEFRRVSAADYFRKTGL